MPLSPALRPPPALRWSLAAIAISLAAPRIALHFSYDLPLIHINSMALAAYSLLQIPFFLVDILSLSRDGQRMGRGSIWAPISMAIAFSWLIPIGADGSSPSQMLLSLLTRAWS